MSIEIYEELSKQEQIQLPKGFVSSFIFRTKIILGVISNRLFKSKKDRGLTTLEKKLIADDTTFFNEHIKKHTKYEVFDEFGKIYYLSIPKNDAQELDLKSKDPIIIFIHGLGGNLHQFDEQYNHFYQRYDIIGFDLPGSGSSVLSDPKYVLTLHNFTRFVIEFLESKELIERDFILIGHSYGTQVVLNLMHHLNSKQLKRIVLLAPPKFPALKPFSAVFFLKIFYTFPIFFEFFRKFDRINNINSNSLKRLFSTSKFDTVDNYYKLKQFKFNLQTNTNNFLNHIINWEPIKLDELVTSVNHLKTNENFKKILIIDGEEDKVTKDGGSSYKAVLGEDVDYKVIPKAGHNLLLDSYQELNRLLDEEIY